MPTDLYIVHKQMQKKTGPRWDLGNSVGKLHETNWGPGNFDTHYFMKY